MKPGLIQRQSKDRIQSNTLKREDAHYAFSAPRKYVSSDERQLYQSWPLADLYAQPVKDYPAKNENEFLSWALDVLVQSPAARLMIKEAVNENWSLALGDLDGLDYHLNTLEKLIVLDNQSFLPGALARSEHFRNTVLISFIRALRDAWQEKRHGGFDETYGPEDILMLERVRAADCDVIATLVSWELRSEGFQDLWRHMIGSEQGDIALMFSDALERDPSSMFTNKALKEAFKQWYVDENRITACDHETLEYMDELIRAYPNENPFGDQPLMATSIELLSCLPDKTAYLQGLGPTIMSDPNYVGMGDFVNQSHFMQIMYDLQVTRVAGVPFRDANLAGKIFPRAFAESGTLH